MWRNGYKRPNIERDREVRRIRDKRKRAEMRKWFLDYKSLLKCEVCDENHPSTLDFHHKDPEIKIKEVGVMISSVPKYSKREILKEIGKCIVLCANCHRKLHWEKFQT